MARLAIRGGPKAVEKDYPEAFKWPVFGEEEKRAVLEVLGSDDIYGVIREFERDAAKYFGVRYVLAQNNGTSTIHAALFAVGVGPGDEVITTSHGWLLQIMPILACRAVPVFVDIDPKTLTMDPEDLRRKITDRTKAILVLHAYGHPADMDPIMEIAEERGIPVIEDCSHAHGAEYKGRKVGTIGDIGCFSLQAGKLMTGIEGGMLITNNEEYYERAVLLGHYERVPELRSEFYRRLREDVVGIYGFTGACLGFKYRIHPLAAALARVQLRHLDERNEIRRRNMDYITKGLQDLEAVEPPYVAPHVKMAWLIYLPRYYRERLKGIPKSLFVRALRAEGVRVAEEGGYRPFHLARILQLDDMYGKGCPWSCPHVRGRPKYGPGQLPVTERINELLFRLEVVKNECPRELLDQYIEAFHKVVRYSDELLELM